MIDLKNVFFNTYSERSSLILEDYERLLPKGTSLAKADEVWRSWYKKANIYVFWANAVSNTSNTRSRHLFQLFTNDRQQRGRRHWWKTGGWKGSSCGTSETATGQKQQREINTSRKISNEQQLLDIWNEKTEHIDEDKTFLLTLVPAFKNLKDDKNYWTKTKMLGIMGKIKIQCFSHRLHKLVPQEFLYHRPMSTISSLRTHLHCQTFQTTKF